MHGDHHGLWIDPANPTILYNANDGGVLSVGRCAARRGSSPVAAGGVAVLQRRARHELAGRGPTDRSRTSAAGAARSTSARAAIGSRPSRARTRPAAKARITPSIPTNPNIVYSHGFYGNFTPRPDLGAAGRRPQARPRRRASAFSRPIPTAELRAQWMAPFIISPHDSQHRLRGLSVPVPIDEPRRHVGEDQPAT